MKTNVKTTFATLSKFSSKFVMLLVLGFFALTFSSCEEDDVINYADDLPGVYESLAGDVNVEGAINLITISNRGDSEALTKTFVVEITDKDTETTLGVETVRYSTNNNNVDITRVGDVITLSITGSEYVQNDTEIYIGTKNVND